MDEIVTPIPIQIVNLTKAVVCTCEVVSGGYIVSRASCPVHGGKAMGDFICEKVYGETGGAK